MESAKPTTADPLLEKLERALARLETASSFAKSSHQGRALGLVRRILQTPQGPAVLYPFAPRFGPAGLFHGSDWDQPAALVPGLVSHTLAHGRPDTVALECASQLRILAVARGDAHEPGFAAEQARHYLAQVLALNLDRLFGDRTEAQRSEPLADAVEAQFAYLMDHVGTRDILAQLVQEIWRILAQRPVHVGRVKAMVTRISVAVHEGLGELGEAHLGIDRLVGALFRPTAATRDDPGVEAYRARLDTMDAYALEAEAQGFARAMHDVGLVSDYHPVFLRWVVDQGQPSLLGDALGLGRTGRDSLRLHRDLVETLVGRALHPATAQAVYGLAGLLERGVLHDPSVGPSLRRQLHVELAPTVEERLALVYGDAVTPAERLLAGVVAVLGQPLGVGQGNNPTCQAARAISMWSYRDPDFLLHLVWQAATHDDVHMHFEGQLVASAALTGPRRQPSFDTDPVSVVLVPHLDAIYAEMGRRCADRAGDPHQWINPELHGWWVGRTFRIAVDVGTGRLRDHEAFLERFYLRHHPAHNGGHPIIHPQPAGLAVTDATGSFVGWHAITLLRVAPDPENTVRFYFFNPNNDGGQDWGHGVVVSTHGNGERHGESSLPFAALASRIYIFHESATPLPGERPPSAETVRSVHEMAVASWARGREAD